MATASGLVVCVGEVLGGGLTPIIAGHLIEQFGIAHFLSLPLVAMVVAVILALCLDKEPAPPSCHHRK